jgi:UDP-N-acetylglucosamine 2-epimerase
MVDDLMDEFGLQADFDLRVMRHNQDLAHVLSESLRGLSDLIERARPDWVLVQGDTATTFAGAWPPSTTACGSVTSRRACAPASATVRFPRKPTGR